MEKLDNPQEEYIVIFRTLLTNTEAINAMHRQADLRVIIMHRKTQLLAAMPEKDFAAFAGMQKLPDPPEGEASAMERFRGEKASPYPPENRQ